MTDDEAAMLWYIVNKIEPSVMLGMEFDVEVFTSIKHRALMNRLMNAEKLVKDEYKNLYTGLVDKLKLV